MNKGYVSLDLSPMRRGYRVGRTPIKISVTEPTLEKLEEAGILKRIPASEPGKKVASRGGYASAFTEFSIMLLLALLEKDHQSQLETLAREMDVFLVSVNDKDLVRKNLEALEKLL